MALASATHARLLDAAASLFRSKGYAGATTRELSALVGIQSASMYHHVRTKGDLLYTLCTESLSTITETVGEAISHESDPVAQLQVLITTHLVTSLADQDKHATMLMELRSLPEERREVVTAMRDRYEDMIEEVVGAGQAAGLLRSDVPARLLTLALLNLLNWTIFWFHPAGDRSVNEIATAFASIYLDGVVVAQPSAGEAH